MSHFIVTGANGFVGRALCRALLDDGHIVTGLVRTPNGCVDGVNEWVFRGADYARLAEAWPQDLQADGLIHLAARVHVMKERAVDPEAAFHATNVDGTLRVAQAACLHDVRRFVFVSSIKAVAETDHGQPLRESDTPAPEDAYGRSKLAAEQALCRLPDTSNTPDARDAAGLELVIVRPPLVYGPDVRANFLRLMDALWHGVPLPLGAISARRSLVYVNNLADALKQCATDPRAAGGTFHVADDEAPTVTELLQRLCRQMGRPARLLAVNPAWLRALERLTGTTKRTDRLTSSLRVDTSRLCGTLGWRAPYSLDEGLAETARWYRSTHG